MKEFLSNKVNEQTFVPLYEKTDIPEIKLHDIKNILNINVFRNNYQDPSCTKEKSEHEMAVEVKINKPKRHNICTNLTSSIDTNVEIPSNTVSVTGMNHHQHSHEKKD